MIIFDNLDFFVRVNGVADVVDTGDGIVNLLFDGIGRIVFGTGPSNLAEIVIVVVADLEVKGTGLFEVSGVRFAKDFIRVATVLDFETDFEFGIGPDLVVDDTTGFLRGENEMNAE